MTYGKTALWGAVIGFVVGAVPGGILLFLAFKDGFWLIFYGLSVMGVQDDVVEVLMILGTITAIVLPIWGAIIGAGLGRSKCLREFLSRPQ